MTTASATRAIDLTHVEKVYRGRVRALNGITMQVDRGEIFGLLGPNGAGKSTLVKIMMTIIRPTKAQGTVLGRPVGDKPSLSKVGFLPEHHRMPAHLSGRQAIDFYGALAGVSKAERKQRMPGLLDLVGMSHAADRKIGGYSKGMMQRIGLAQALINEPELIVLDEPTDGVDPVGRKEIRDLLVQLKAAGKTVFINSHILSELEMVCDRVAILVGGNLVQQGTIDELTRDSRRYEIRITGDTPAWMETIPHVRATSSAGQTVIVQSSDDPHPVQAVIDRLRGDGRTILAVEPKRESLEDLFVRAVGGQSDNSPPGAPAPAPAMASGGAA
ncbi:MAG: ATP-binding cassette domain-containing protein [Phycisphaerales bacterium]